MPLTPAPPAARTASVAAFPPAVARVLEGARHAFAPPPGPVLHLDDEPRRLDELARAGGPPGGFAAITSFGALSTYADLPAALVAVRTLLAGAGLLHVVEPTRGWGRAAFALGTLPWPATRGRHLGRDLPVAMRALQLAPLDQERFVMPTSVPPLRPWVRLTATHLADLTTVQR